MFQIIGVGIFDIHGDGNKDADARMTPTALHVLLYKTSENVSIFSYETAVLDFYH